MTSIICLLSEKAKGYLTSLTSVSGKACKQDQAFHFYLNILNSLIYLKIELKQRKNAESPFH